MLNTHPQTLVYFGSKGQKDSVDEDSRFFGGREREPEIRGRTASVLLDGAEAGVVAVTRADAAENNRTYILRHVPPLSICPVVAAAPPTVDEATSADGNTEGVVILGGEERRIWERRTDFFFFYC